MATNGNTNLQEQFAAATAAAADAALAAGDNSPSPSKDEVGWYFVEQYYTTLSKNPSKLHVSSAPALGSVGAPRRLTGQ